MDTKPITRPELPPGWTDYPPLDPGRLGSIETPEPCGITYKRVDGPDRAKAIADAWKMSAGEPWVDFADAQTRRAEAAEQALAAKTAERDALADSILKLTAERDAYKASADRAAQRCDKALRAELAHTLESDP